MKLFIVFSYQCNTILFLGTAIILEQFNIFLLVVCGAFWLRSEMFTYYACDNSTRALQKAIIYKQTCIHIYMYSVFIYIYI